MPPAATTEVERPTGEVSAPRGGSGRKAYLHHLDLIRATTFSLVIFVHCLTQTTDEQMSLGTNSMSLLLHFTRNTFFALTGFVLMYQNFAKDDFSAPQFWVKRIKLVIFPYLIWSTIYWVVTVMWAHGQFTDIPFSLDNYLWNLGWGMSGFHMYFLLVMLQVYLLFPAVLWLVRRTVDHHGWLLAVSFVVQVAVTATITHWTPPPALGNVWWHNYATFVPYQFFILYGAVAAVHREKISVWLRGKGWLLTALAVVTGALAMGTFLMRVYVDNQRPIDASSPFQPTLLPFLLVAIACLYAIASHWNYTRRATTPRFARVVAYASNRSFTVFLVHVLVLFFVLLPKAADGRPWILAHLPAPLGTLSVYLLTVAGALALTEVLRRLPGSQYLAGRERLPLPSLRGRIARPGQPVPDATDTAVSSARGLASSGSRK